VRVLLINHEYTISGASLLMLRLARHLRDSGRPCDTMCMLNRDGPVLEQYAALGIPHPVTADFADYGAVICNTIFTAPVVPHAAKFAKTVWWIHEGGNGLDHILHTPSDWPAFQVATAIVFQTEFQRDVLYRRFLGDRGRSFVIPVGIDVAMSGRASPRRGHSGSSRSARSTPGSATAISSTPSRRCSATTSSA
jgi:hypothetical protein